MNWYHGDACAIFTAWHERAANGQPGRFHSVPCDCYLSR